MSEKLLQILGMARRAGALSLGHDASVDAVRRKKAALCLVSSDASDRLYKEFCYFKELTCIRIPCTMEDLSIAISYKAGVLTINDKNFAAKVKLLCESDSNEGDSNI